MSASSCCVYIPGSNPYLLHQRTMNVLSFNRVSKMASRTPPPSSKRYHNERMMFRQRHLAANGHQQHQGGSKSRDSSPNASSVGTPVSVVKSRQGHAQQQHQQQQHQHQQTATPPSASPNNSNEGKQGSGEHCRIIIHFLEVLFCCPFWSFSLHQIFELSYRSSSRPRRGRSRRRSCTRRSRTRSSCAA